jgi:hypothetical protein
MVITKVALNQGMNVPQHSPANFIYGFRLHPSSPLLRRDKSDFGAASQHHKPAFWRAVKVGLAKASRFTR